MALRYGLLGLLNYTESTGYDLKKIFDDSLNFFWQAQKSQIYRELSTMKKEKLVTVKLVVQKHKPNKKVYAITKQGKTALIQWLKSDLDLNNFVVRNAFLIKIFFGGEIESKIILERIQEFLEMHNQIIKNHKVIEKNIENYSTSVDKQKEKYWKLTSLFGLEYSKMCIKWSKAAIKILENKD